MDAMFRNVKPKSILWQIRMYLSGGGGSINYLRKGEGEKRKGVRRKQSLKPVKKWNSVAGGKTAEMGARGARRLGKGQSV
ncbi:hypothetical protein [Desulfatiglans anilini]|uniref:hypothetical protein n=1 Tax=Desulfatiglans anilini TaxID=90728 RepID=UPI0003F57213|nr:hypothetical protein [Desulfatiglans anilini]